MHIQSAHTSPNATRISQAFQAPYGQTPEALQATKKVRMEAALEIQKALQSNLEQLLAGVREMTSEESLSWIVKIDGISLFFDDLGSTYPAAADKATKFAKDAAMKLAPLVHNGAGKAGTAMPYTVGLNEDLTKCAKALHEIAGVISEMALDF